MQGLLRTTEAVPFYCHILHQYHYKQIKKIVLLLNLFDERRLLEYFTLYLLAWISRLLLLNLAS